MRPARRRDQAGRRNAARPFVFLNAAMSADGKLAPATRQYQPFGSPRDTALLHELRARADAVLCGARTADLYPVVLGNGGPRYERLRARRRLAPHPLRVIVSGSGSISPKAEVFRHRFSPILILTTRRVPAARLRRLKKLADAVVVAGSREIDFPKALRKLHANWKVKRLLCEGGGQVNEALFRAGLVDEVFVTVCPLILGGRSAPTLADGRGFRSLSAAARLERVSMRRSGAELFLRYRVVRKTSNP